MNSTPHSQTAAMVGSGDMSEFERRVQGLTINDASFRNEMEKNTPPEKTYVVVFSARSGSTWLTSILSKTEALGYPEEYINPDFIRDVAQFLNTADPSSFLEILKRRRKTKNEIFGIECRAVDILCIGEGSFFKSFDKETIFFNLWRKNIVAQAISLYRAVTTGRFHSNDGKQEQTLASYDVKAIRTWLEHIAEEENSNISMLEKQHKPFTNLCYEVIIKDRGGTIQLFADKLGVKTDSFEIGNPENEDIQKIGDGWNVEAEQRFRSEHPDFLARIERNRLIRRYETF